MTILPNTGCPPSKPRALQASRADMNPCSSTLYSPGSNVTTVGVVEAGNEFGVGLTA